MARPDLEVADIFRDHGPAWREANRGHVSLGQLKVMGAIERCRTAALGGHVARCENTACAHTEIGYNSCRNRHCPKCQGAASRRWLAEREAELLPVPYFHVVYTLPSQLRDIACQNKRVIYNLLMKAAADTTLAIASDPKRLGARIGITAVLHSWGSALTHHPHVHMIVPGGGLSFDNAQWVAARPDFLVHVKVLARLFRGKMLAMLIAAHDNGELKFFNTHAELADKKTFKRFIAPLRRIKLGGLLQGAHSQGPSRSCAISPVTPTASPSRTAASLQPNGGAIAFRWKDYRLEGPDRWKTMRLHPHEFIRRFLIHVLPKGFHRIRHYGLFANTNRVENIATARALLNVAPPAADTQEQPDIASRNTTRAALPLPALRWPHDRDRDLRARLRTALAPDVEQDRYIMSQTSRKRRHFPVPDALAPSRQQSLSPKSPRSTLPELVDSVQSACPDVHRPLPVSVCRSADRILPTSLPSQSSAPALNPHSARGHAGAQPPATSCLGAFRTPVVGAWG